MKCSGVPVVVVADELTHRVVEFCKGEGGFWPFAAVHDSSGERCQEFGVDGAEEPLDFSSAVGSGDGGVDDAEVQVECCLFEAAAGEVGTVVDVEDVGDAAHDPGRVGLVPDRLPER